jgi:hypothetical protein
MRSAARLKMGYYPLPESEGKKLRSLLSFASPASVIDPCVGQGTALQLLTSDAPVRRYGVELDAERARVASSKGIETIQGNTFDAIAKSEHSPCCTSIRRMTPRLAPLRIGAWRLCFWNTPTVGCEWTAF